MREHAQQQQPWHRSNQDSESRDDVGSETVISDTSEHMHARVHGCLQPQQQLDDDDDDDESLSINRERIAQLEFTHERQIPITDSVKHRNCTSDSVDVHAQRATQSVSREIGSHAHQRADAETHQE